jgi:hypothetical protein
MPVTVKKIVLWRKEVDNRAGTLAATLEPLAKTGADLRVLMGYRYPGNEAKAVIELHPVAGKKVTSAAEQAGLAASSIPTLLVEGDDKPGLAHRIAQAVADAGVNLSFLVAQVLGKRFVATLGFETEADANKAASLIKKSATSQTKARGR